MSMLPDGVENGTLVRNSPVQDSSSESGGTCCVNDENTAESSRHRAVDVKDSLAKGKAVDEGDVSTDKRLGQQRYAFEKPPPPIKTRRESHITSPPELSPPPSPKRMKELERKEGVFSRVIVPPSQEPQ